jgi:hypothetical protein
MQNEQQQGQRNRKGKSEGEDDRCHGLRKMTSPLRALSAG